MTGGMIEGVLLSRELVVMETQDGVN